MRKTRRGFVRSICQTLSVFTFDQLVRAPLGVQFVNVAREAGLRSKAIFCSEHKNKFLLETTGAAFFDYDNDDKLAGVATDQVITVIEGKGTQK